MRGPAAAAVRRRAVALLVSVALVLGAVSPAGAAVVGFPGAYFVSSAGDGVLPDRTSSVLPFVVESDVALSAADVRVASGDSGVVRVLETCFYRVAGAGGPRGSYYLGAAYLRSGARGDTVLSVTVSSAALAAPARAEFPIAVRPQVNELIFLTSAATMHKHDSHAISNSSARLGFGKSLVLKAFVRNVDSYWRSQGLNGLAEESFDNIYPVPARSLKWSDSGYHSGYVKVDRRTGRVTFRKRGAASEYAGPAIYASYKGAKTDPFNISGTKKVKAGALKLDRDRRRLLLRGEVRVLCASVEYKGEITAAGRLKWSSSNGRVASVDALGVVRARSPGKATFTVRLGGRKAKVSYRVVTLETYMRKYYSVVNGSITVDEDVLFRH